MPFIWQRHPTSELASIVKGTEARFKLKDYLLSGLIVKNTFIGVISARKRTAVDEAEYVVAGLADNIRASDENTKQFTQGSTGGPAIVGGFHD